MMRWSATAAYVCKRCKFNGKLWNNHKWYRRWNTSIANSEHRQRNQAKSYNKSIAMPKSIPPIATETIQKYYYKKSWVYQEMGCIDGLTWLWGKLWIGFSLKMNGTGMNKNDVIRNMQPVTTPIASGLQWNSIQSLLLLKKYFFFQI